MSTQVQLAFSGVFNYLKWGEMQLKASQKASGTIVSKVKNELQYAIKKLNQNQKLTRWNYFFVVVVWINVPE